MVCVKGRIWGGEAAVDGWGQESAEEGETDGAVQGAALLHA